MNEIKSIDSTMDEKDHERVDRFQRRLKQELEELLLLQQQNSGRIEQSVRDLQGSDGPEIAQVAHAAMAIDRVRKVQVARLRRALRQMEEGEYGYCVTCGGDIGEARLESDPAIHVCANCAVLRSL